jgi:hypothetical protein
LIQGYREGLSRRQQGLQTSDVLKTSDVFGEQSIGKAKDNSGFRHRMFRKHPMSRKLRYEYTMNEIEK